MLKLTEPEEMAYLGICLADPVRIELIKLIATHPGLGVSEMAEKLGRPQPNVSQHLAMLRRHGMIRADRKGTSVHYRFIEPRILWWLEGLMRAWMSAPGQKEWEASGYDLGGEQPAFTKGIT